MVYQQFINEISESISEIAKRHNLHEVALKIALTSDNTIAINMHFSPKEKDEQYQEWYTNLNEKLGLKLEWLDSEIYFSSIEKNLKVIGLDEGMSAHSIVLKDEDSYYFLSVEDFIKIKD